jgi:hypothetical protein
MGAPNRMIVLVGLSLGFNSLNNVKKFNAGLSVFSSVSTV